MNMQSKKDRFSGGRHPPEHPRNGNHILAEYKGAVFFQLKLHNGQCSGVCEVDIGVIVGSAHFVTMKNVDEIEQYRELVVESWRGD